MRAEEKKSQTNLLAFRHRTEWEKEGEGEGEEMQLPCIYQV